MELLYARCAGLDVHKDTVVACRRVEAGGTFQQEVRTFGTTTRDLGKLTDWLTEVHITHLVMEAIGIYWRPVWHILEGHFELILANAQHVRNVPGRKSDASDAQWLAELLAHGLVRGSFVPPSQVQEVRELTRTRRQLVRTISQNTQRIQKTLESANLKLSSVVTDTLGVTSRLILKALHKGETDPEVLANLACGRLKNKRSELVEALHGHVTDHHRFLIGLHLRLIEGLEKEIERIEKRLGKLLKPLAEQEERLATIPGVSTTVAQVVLAKDGARSSCLGGCEDQRELPAQQIPTDQVTPRRDQGHHRHRRRPPAGLLLHPAGRRGLQRSGGRVLRAPGQEPRRPPPCQAPPGTRIRSCHRPSCLMNQGLQGQLEFLFR